MTYPPFEILTDALKFPNPEDAPKRFPLAVGGDLCVERLLLAYRNGIFPWYTEDEPILWWCPDPRMVLFPDEFHRSRSLRRTLNKKQYRLTMDTCFVEVISHCAHIYRPHQEGTWLTPEMQKAYCTLHEAGYAHSVEVWLDDTLAGGLYGISLGSIFFGESMFSLKANTSKIAFSALVEQLIAWRFLLIDCQASNEHLATLGCREIPRKQFLCLLREGIQRPTRQSKWCFDIHV